MAAQVRLLDDDGRDLASLWTWLQRESALRGRVTLVRQPIPDQKMGAATDTLSVLFGGAGTVLAQSLITWIQARRTASRVTLEAHGKTVTFDVRSAQEALPVIQQILQEPEDDP
ncbi:effector-associated constant component EACC1 [Streptomyces spinosirectus]